MNDDSLMVQGLSKQRYAMLLIFAVAIYINYTSIYWLEEVGHYQTLMFAMVFQTISVLTAKTADDTLESDSSREAIAEVLSAIAQVYLFNGITKFSGTWFDTKFRSIATGVILVFGILGQYTPVWIRYTWLKSGPFLREHELQ